MKLELNDKITLYNADCIEILKSIPDASIDLIVTDPPYLIPQINGGGSINNSSMRFNQRLQCLKDNQDITLGYDIDKFADEVERIQGGNINAYFWCNKAQIMQYFKTYVERLGCKFDILTWHKCLHSSTNIIVKEPNGTIKRCLLKDVFRKRVDLWVYDGCDWTKIVDIVPNTNVSEYLEITLKDGNKIKCTNEHRFCVDGKLIEAKDLTVGAILDSCTIPTNNNDEICGITPTMQWFIGHYIAEGNKLYKKENRVISIATNKQNTFVLNQITQLCKEYDATFSVYDNYSKGNGRVIHIRSAVIAAIIDNYVVGKTSYNKHFTKKLFNTSKDFIDNVLRGYLDGDAYYDSVNNRYRLGFTYKNTELARDFTTICNILGYRIFLGKGYSMCDGKQFPIHKGEIRMIWDKQKSKSQFEIVNITLKHNRAGNVFYDLCLDNENHLFALYDGVLTHNSNPIPNMSNKYLTDTEYCLYFHKGKGQMHPETYDDARTCWFEPINGKDKQKYQHPTCKPLKIIGILVRNSSNVGDTVLDCFMGSGTTGVACLERNRKFIGIEINETYFNIAKKRITDNLKNLTLF